MILLRLFARMKLFEQPMEDIRLFWFVLLIVRVLAPASIKLEIDIEYLNSLIQMVLNPVPELQIIGIE